MQSLVTASERKLKELCRREITAVATQCSPEELRVIEEAAAQMTANIVRLLSEQAHRFENLPERKQQNVTTVESAPVDKDLVRNISELEEKVESLSEIVHKYRTTIPAQFAENAVEKLMARTPLGNASNDQLVAMKSQNVTETNLSPEKLDKENRIWEENLEESNFKLMASDVENIADQVKDLQDSLLPVLKAVQQTNEAVEDSLKSRKRKAASPQSTAYVGGTVEHGNPRRTLSSRLVKSLTKAS